jgi:response regulator RpfG family c-di-GMP phosphodiesterase
MKKLLLIVDDNPEIVDVIKLFLSDMYDEVHTASTVDEAQDLLTTHKFTMMTLDINLHGRNGSEIIKFIMDNPENANKKTPIILISGMMTPEFIEKNKSRFAGVLTKPFEMSVLRQIAEDVNKGAMPEKKTIELRDLNNVPQIKCKMPFTVAQLEEKVEQVLVEIRKENKLKKLFASMKINRDPESYLAVKVGMLINISTAISMKLEWNTEKTLSKFVYASYLHDIALADRNDLAQISSFEELTKKKATLTPSDYKLVFEHPNIAATTLGDFRDIPMDVLTIVRQHHELPNETGFPSKISHKKIIPMSVVFIVSHDLTTYILANPKWNLADYLIQAKPKFTGAHFVKTLAALETLG